MYAPDEISQAVRNLSHDELKAGFQSQLADRIEKLEEDSRFLNALKAQGVDNWDPGYHLAWISVNS